MNNNKKIINYTLSTVLIILLCTWYIPNFREGIDFSDTSFSLTKYKYVFNSAHSLSAFTTYLSDIVGGIVYHVYPSHQLLRLQLTNAFLGLSGTFLVIYNFRKELPTHLMLITALTNHFFIFSTLHIFNYNTATFFIMIIAFLTLIKSIQKENDKLLFISGFLCGINTFFRIPNILHCAMVLGILWYDLICNKKTFKLGTKRTLRYIAGIICAFIAGTVGATLYMGPDKVFNSLSSTVAKLLVPSETNTHSGVSIFSKLFSHLESSLKAWWFFGVLLVIFILLYWLRKKKQYMSKCPQSESLIHIVMGGSIGILSFRLIWDNVLESHQRMVSINYHMWIILIFISVLASIYGAFAYRYKDPYISTICILNIVLILVLPFGTDVGYLYYNFYTFMANIVTLLVLTKLKKEQKESSYTVYPFILSFILCYTFITGYQFQSIYVYRDAAPEYLTESVDIPELYGMKTSAGRAQALTFLVDILEPYEEYEVATLGDFNILPVITDMKCFFTTPWPDLASFSEEKFMTQLEEKTSTGNLPVIVFSARTSYMTDGNSPYRSTAKYEALLEVVKTYDYETLFYNDYYQIFVPVKK